MLVPDFHENVVFIVTFTQIHLCTHDLRNAVTVV